MQGMEKEKTLGRLNFNIYNLIAVSKATFTDLKFVTNIFVEGIITGHYISLFQRVHRF
jgi:uncharacterized membrane protein (DUF106 family)